MCWRHLLTTRTAFRELQTILPVARSLHGSSFYATEGQYFPIIFWYVVDDVKDDDDEEAVRYFCTGSLAQRLAFR
jgi:hypothetical protein